MDKFSEEQATELQSIDWRNLSINDISQDYYLTCYFLETKKHFDSSFSWMRWLDLDTLEMLTATFNNICVKDLDDEETSDEATDFFCLTLSLYFWENEEEDFPSPEKLEKIMNLVGHCASLTLMERNGKINLIELGSGSIFKGDMTYKAVRS